MLTVENVSCGYGSNMVVKEVSFAVNENEILCILGPNGCGKTTLLRAIAGLLPSSGKVSIDGVDIRQTERKKMAAQIGFMNQITSVTFTYTVYETVMMGRYAHQKSGIFTAEQKNDKAMVLQSLNQVGMFELKDRQITELSGGQLQRVFLARVLAQNPHIILLDEPTNHLDIKYQIELMDQMREWAKKEKRCVVGVLHDINHAFMFADKILLLKNGCVETFCTADAFDLYSLNAAYNTDVKSYMQNSLKRWKSQ